MGKTTQVAADRAYDDASTVVPTEVARGIYMRNAPSLRALKIMHLMIATAAGRMADDVLHEIRLADIRRIDGMAHYDKESLKPLLQELSAAVLTYDDPKAMRYTIGGLLSYAEVDYRHENRGDVQISWAFGKSFRDMAEKSNHWSILDRQTMFHIASKYSLLLFQHIASLSRLTHVHSKTFTISELREVLGVPERKLTRFADLNRRALQSAIKEINQLSRLELRATPNKTGRTVSSVTISWAPHTDPAGVRRELDSSKVGRKARRSGSSETVIDAFPAQGGIAYNSYWKQIKRDAGSNKDDNMIAEDFRKFCQAQGIPLTAKNIATIFANYCRKVGKV